MTPDGADAVFEAVELTAQRSDGAARLLIIDDKARIVHATSDGLALFGARDRADLQARLLAGEGPTARRLRHLAETLPIGAAPRLERMRVSLGRRSTSVNLRCARVSAPEGSALLALWTTTVSARKDQATAVAVADEKPPPARTVGANAKEPPKLRFLWSLDREGGFGAADPVLVRALGADAPRLGETLDALGLRTGLTGGDEIAAAVEKRETFTDAPLIWPSANGNRPSRIKLSGTPVFERGREFAGYRGFGRLDDPIGVSDRPEADPSSVAAADPEAPAPEDAARDQAAEHVDPIAIADRIAPVTQTDAVQPVLEAKTGSFVLPEMPEPAATAAAVVTQSEILADAGAPAESADGSEPLLASPETAGALTGSSASPNTGPIEDISAVDTSTAVANVPPERTAEIFVLRQTHTSASKIVPIRPGALEALALDPAPGSGSESVELSKSERDAFREIARALVGRPNNAPGDAASDGSNTGADVQGPPDAALAAPASPSPRGEVPKPGAVVEAGEMVWNNASALLDRLPIGVLVVSDAQALYLNRTLLDLLGYRDFEHFRESNGLAAMFRGSDPQTMSTEEHGALRIFRADGQPLAVDGHAQAVSWDAAPATLIAFRRLREGGLESERRPVENEMQTRSGAESDLQDMLDHATDGAVTLDSAGRILSLNRPAEKLFGYDRRDIVGESVLMLLAPQSHTETTARLEELSRQVDSSSAGRAIQVVGRDRAGAALSLDLTLAQIGPAETPHYCALMRDIGREHEAERKLTAARDAAQTASAAKTDFLAQVSHEIRTPLHAILGFAEVMMEERFGPIGNERYKDYLKDIHASGTHVMSLADDLLDLSKIEAGKLELAFAPVDANSLIRECVSMIQPQAARERIIMRVSLFERLPPVMVDERSLKQIMLNLMSNAVKFNEPGGQVIVSTAVDAAGQAVIRVRDTGLGMSEGEVGLALEPFSQIRGAGRKGGAGLGLPLTKALVEANGAEFSIKSRRDQGTLIEIAFPTVRAA